MATQFAYTTPRSRRGNDRSVRPGDLECRRLRRVFQAASSRVPALYPLEAWIPEGAAASPPSLASRRSNQLGDYGEPNNFPRIYATGRLVLDYLGMSVALPRHTDRPSLGNFIGERLRRAALFCVVLRNNYPKFTHGDVQPIRGGLASAGGEARHPQVCHVSIQGRCRGVGRSGGGRDHGRLPWRGS